MLDGLSCFRSTDKKTDWNITQLINAGRARSLNGFPKRELEQRALKAVRSKHDGRLVMEGCVYVTAHGDLLDNCDTAYADQQHHLIGNVLKQDAGTLLSLVIPEEKPCLTNNK